MLVALTVLPPDVPGRWEVVLDDGDVLTVDTRAGTPLSFAEGGWGGLVSVDSCEVGTPVAFTARDSTGVEVPWFGGTAGFDPARCRKAH
jgi:hypothetical protein